MDCESTNQSHARDEKQLEGRILTEAMHETRENRSLHQILPAHRGRSFKLQRPREPT